MGEEGQPVLPDGRAARLAVPERGAVRRGVPARSRMRSRSRTAFSAADRAAAEASARLGAFGPEPIVAQSVRPDDPGSASGCRGQAVPAATAWATRAWRAARSSECPRGGVGRVLAGMAVPARRVAHVCLHNRDQRRAERVDADAATAARFRRPAPHPARRQSCGRDREDHGRPPVPRRGRHPDEERRAGRKDPEPGQPRVPRRCMPGGRSRGRPAFDDGSSRRPRSAPIIPGPAADATQVAWIEAAFLVGDRARVGAGDRKPASCSPDPEIPSCRARASSGGVRKREDLRLRGGRDLTEHFGSRGRGDGPDRRSRVVPFPPWGSHLPSC